ncbi:alpha/beta hydrolase [Cnuibacter sp. UC19_7]|uniref:alpha/beta hydrolase n=1 Tax=Cnuibacter sp. UC19_7 TaxID=3350166 RepID=UPI00366D0D60
MRTDIEFDADGVTLRGWFYSPESSTPAPAVVMSHGFAALKEMGLHEYALRFVDAGLAVLVFDHRNFGASDGQPRFEIDPWQQMTDYRHAVSYLQTRPDVDPERIGAWGTSYSGGHVIILGALDRRVKAVSSQVPVVSGFAAVQRLVRQDLLPDQRAAWEKDRRDRFAGAAPATIPIVDPDPTASVAFPTADSYKWFTSAAQNAPAWENVVTVASLEKLTEYEPRAYIDRISPTPFLLMVGQDDTVASSDLPLAAFEQALEPKQLEILPGGHYDPYGGTSFETAVTTARDFFVEHLADRTA